VSGRFGGYLTIQLDDFGLWNMRGEKPTSLDADRWILCPVQHKRWDENRLQDIFDVEPRAQFLKASTTSGAPSKRRQPMSWLATYSPAVDQGSSPRIAKAIETAGLKCA
jgi:hypothetical protein